MQHDDGRRVRGRGTDHAVFEIGGADVEEAGGGEGGHDVGFRNAQRAGQFVDSELIRDP